MKAFLVIFPFVFMFSASPMLAKPSVRGSGNVIKEDRESGSFTRLVVSDAVEVVLTKAGQEKVIVEAEDNIMPLVVVENNGDKLSVRLKELASVNSEKGIKVYVSYTQLNEVFVSSASKLSTNVPLEGEKLLLILSGASQASVDVRVGWLSVNCSGASKGTITGVAEKLNIQCSGASKINALQLQAKDADIDASGASTVQVDAGQKLSILASGASSVQYVRHEGAAIDRSTSGASIAEPL